MCPGPEGTASPESGSDARVGAAKGLFPPSRMYNSHSRLGVQVHNTPPGETSLSRRPAPSLSSATEAGRQPSPERAGLAARP